MDRRLSQLIRRYLAPWAALTVGLLVGAGLLSARPFLPLTLNVGELGEAGGASRAGSGRYYRRGRRWVMDDGLPITGGGATVWGLGYGLFEEDCLGFGSFGGGLLTGAG